MPDEFRLALLEEDLAGTRFAGSVHHLPRTGSTNQLAVEAAAKGERNAVWIADEQTAGRGRGGHSWHSPAGSGLYLTALAAPRIPLYEARWLPLRTGLAVRSAVLAATGLTLDLRWPNDLFLEGRKCGGILLESGSDPAPGDSVSEAGPALRYAAIGIGLNVGHQAFPPEISTRATSLWIETGRLFQREILAAGILNQLENELQLAETEWLVGASGQEVSRRFSAASTWISGRRVRIGADEAGHGGYTAVTRGLDREGFLRVQDDEGLEHTVVSGNVRAAGD